MVPSGYRAIVTSQMYHFLSETSSRPSTAHGATCGLAATVSKWEILGAAPFYREERGLPDIGGNAFVTDLEVS